MTVSIESAPFGMLDGQPVRVFVLSNANGCVARISELGATLLSLLLPDRDGALADVVLGFDSLPPYLAPGSPYLGATIGRVANRIRAARCEVDGRQLPLAANDGEHHLHGGLRGFDERLWKGTAKATSAGASVQLSYTAGDGEEGYPGRLQVSVRYLLDATGALQIDMQAVTDAPTLVNLAHHSYWNLGGHASGDILDHELKLHASSYTPGDPVPDGRVLPVSGTPFDFTRSKPIGTDLGQAGANPVGYDHNWVVDGPAHELRPVAELRHPASGRSLRLEADQPGVQFYSGNFLDGSARGKQGAAYQRHAGLCLETQAHPNSPNIPAWSGAVTLLPGETYRHRMLHRFSVEA